MTPHGIAMSLRCNEVWHQLLCPPLPCPTFNDGQTRPGETGILAQNFPLIGKSGGTRTSAWGPAHCHRSTTQTAGAWTLSTWHPAGHPKLSRASRKLGKHCQEDGKRHLKYFVQAH